VRQGRGRGIWSLRAHWNVAPAHQARVAPRLDRRTGLCGPWFVVIRILNLFCSYQVTCLLFPPIFAAMTIPLAGAATDPRSSSRHQCANLIHTNSKLREKSWTLTTRTREIRSPENPLAYESDGLPRGNLHPLNCVQLLSYRWVTAFPSLVLYRKGKFGSVSWLASMQPNQTATKNGKPAKAQLTCTRCSLCGISTSPNLCRSSYYDSIRDSAKS